MSTDVATDAATQSLESTAAKDEIPRQNGTTENAAKSETSKDDAPISADATEKDNDAQENGDGTGENGEGAAPSSAGPAETDKKAKRKSSGGVPEHRGKKLNKKKSMPTLHLDCKPGDHYWARLKGHPPWPAIIADESMLPESLLASRPVSAMQADGSVRPDYQEGGKSAKDRQYAVFYLGTNEFSWIGNVGLTPLDPEECKQGPKSKAKGIAEAYTLAAEQHDLEFYKELLEEANREKQRIEEEKAAAAAEAAQKAEERRAAAEEKKKKAPRKSKAADEDVEMADADTPKSSKKRKKGEESDGEGIKPKKTPKVTKLNGPKTPGEAETPTAKKSAGKPKKKVAAPKAEEEEPAVEMTEEGRLARLHKEILYLRHKLQKGFLTRDEQPKEQEMETMDGLLTQLEKHDKLQPSIIRETKVHKVLKAIIKLSSIPSETKYQFKKRSSSLLEIWNKRMENDNEANGSKSASSDKKATTNGDGATDVKSTDASAEKESSEKEHEKSELTAESKTEEKAQEVTKKLDETVIDDQEEIIENGGKTEETA